MIKTSRYNQGYTLIELSMVILIIGLIIGSGIAAFKIYKTEREMALTETAKVRISLAINSFRERYGRYPCPASYTAQRGTPEYGSSGDCSDLSVAPGTCAQGICVEQSIAGRTVRLDDGTEVIPRVRRGAVPYRALNLSEDEFYDQYGGRFSYAVTELLTDEDTFKVDRGGIHIVDSQPTPRPLVEPEGSALYFMFSHGPDNVGAYGRNGLIMVECNGPMIDVENCNTSASDNTAVYAYAQRSDTPIETGGVVIPGMPPPPVVNVNTHYDDVAYYKGADPIPLFKFSELENRGNDAYDLQESSRIVIGSTTNNEKVNVEGTVKASDNYHTSEVCDEDGENCFAPERIGGAGMHCPDDQYAEGIHGGPDGLGALRCVVPSAHMDCDGGYVTGFVDGIAQCGTVTQSRMCARMNVTVCGVRNTLASSPHGTRITLTGGVSQVQVWRCNDGTWVRQSNRGVCTCTPRTVTTRNACGTGYNGQTTVETTTVCPSGQRNVRTNRSQCSCAPGAGTRTRDCPEGQTGRITERRTTTCNGNVATTSAWSVTSNTCTCAAQAAQTRAGVCPTGTTGNVTERRTWNTGTCSWNAWTETSRNCVCAPSTETRTAACPPGETGTIRERRNIYCNGNPPSAWTEVSRTCNVPPTCRWSNSGAGMTSGNAGPYAGDTCVCGTRNGPCKVRIPGGVQGYTGCQCQ